MQVSTLRTRNPVRPVEQSLWARSATAHAGAPRPTPSGPAVEAEILNLLDDAHLNLGTHAFTAAATVLRREIELLQGGRIPARPRGRLRETGPDLTAEVREYLRPIRRELGRVARYVDVSGGSLSALGDRVGAYLDSLTARRSMAAFP